MPDTPTRTRRWPFAVLILAVLAAGGAYALTRPRPPVEPVAVETTPVATVPVERRTLSTTRSMPGTISYGAARPLSGHTTATVTWLPAVGATIKRGRQLFRADDLPVVLFYGAMPLYRPIATPNQAGRDVRIVEDNLRALGYRTGRRPAGTKRGESVLTPGLIEAIKKWQRDLDRPVTGTIAVGDIEVQTTAVRVESLAVQPGSPAEAPLMNVTSTRKVITVAAEMASFTRGAKVTVTLPDERTVKARILAVGRALASADGNEPPKLTVAVTVDDPATIAALDSADVQVNFPGRTAKNVLAVPVEALVALAEGGYAVEGPHGLIGVRTGMFADGWVQISGDGLTEGLDVVVSS